MSARVIDVAWAVWPCPGMGTYRAQETGWVSRERHASVQQVAEHGRNGCRDVIENGGFLCVRARQCSVRGARSAPAAGAAVRNIAAMALLRSPGPNQRRVLFTLKAHGRGRLMHETMHLLRVAERLPEGLASPPRNAALLSAKFEDL